MSVQAGSVSRAFAFYEKTMYEALSSFAYQTALKRLKIAVSEEPEIAILGAAGLVLDLA